MDKNYPAPTSNTVARAHFVLALVYGFVALLSLLDFTLAQFGLLPELNNLYWFRLHVLTIGLLVQAAFGVLPLLLARRLSTDAPASWQRWLVFALLNAGLLLLAVGQVAGVQWQRSAGGIILLVAALSEIILLAAIWRRAPRPRPILGGFYLAAPFYLLLGILMALTMIDGWWSPRGFQAVKESHIHANIFGFTGILVAGVALDVLPALFGRTLARPRWVTPTFWLMAVGALGLWLGPYLGVLPVIGGSLLIYVGGLALMLANFFLTTHRPTPVRIVNGAHLLLSYIWIAAPAIATLFFVLLGPDNVPLARLELGVTQGLIYGWLTQIALAFLPLAVVRFSSGRWEQVIARQEGSWFTLVVLNLAVAVIWLASVLMQWQQARPLVAIAYLFVFIAMLPYLLRLAQALRRSPSLPA